jgi:hypothetical protein
VRLVLGLAAAALVSLSACDTGQPPGAAPTDDPVVTTAATPSVSACPKPTKRAIEWPASFPADIPKPLGATIIKRPPVPGGVTLAQFSAPYSLREAIVFILDRFPRSGYTLGRGDAENTEADAPFERGQVRGLVKAVIDPAVECRTTWLVAIANSSSVNSPYLTYTTGSSPSPLPFG